MKNETSINNSKNIVNNSSMLTAENSSKHSKFNLKRNKLAAHNSQKYSNTALFENPRRDFSNTITTNKNKRSKKGIYITDVTISKFRDTGLETKTTLETTNVNYNTHNQFLKNRNKTPRRFSKNNALPNITSGFTRNNFGCCDMKLNPEFLAQLYNEQLLFVKDNQNNEKKNKKEKKSTKEDRTEFLRKTNEIKRIKYEMELKKQAMEEYKENIKMQKCGIEFTISNLKTYRDNLENNYLTKYNDNLRKLERELFELKLKSDNQNNELLLLKKEVSSLKLLLVKKENILKNIEKWVYLQIYIKEGEEPKNLKQDLWKYNNKLIFNSLDELNNALTHKENKNLRLMEKFNKSQKEKDGYISELIEQEKEAQNMDQSKDIMVSQKENFLEQLKKREKSLNMNLHSLITERDISQRNKINKRSKSVKNNINIKNANNEELKKNELGIFYKPINTKDDILIYIDCIYTSIISNNINGLILNSKYFSQLNNINISKNRKACIKMKIIEISLNYLISSINKKIVSDKNNLSIMEKTCKLIDLYHKKKNGTKNRMQLQKNWNNLMKKIEEKNKKTYYLPRGKIEKYNIVSIQKKKNEEKLKNKKVVKKIDIWDFLYDQSYDENISNDKIE